MPALEAANLRAPVLIQRHTPADGRFLIASMDFYSEAQANGKPVELVVYFNATHNLSQPWQQLSALRRNLQWFQFWLQGHEDADPAFRSQYERWWAMVPRTR